MLDLNWFKGEVRYSSLPNGITNDRVRQVGGRYNDSTNFDFMMNMGVWTYPGFGTSQQDVCDYRPGLQPVYQMAGATPKDVDALFTYDAFSILAWTALERFGFCGQGEAAAFTQGGRIEVGGALPMNTNGGLLSEGHIMGWNHQVEIVLGEWVELDAHGDAPQELGQEAVVEQLLLGHAAALGGRDSWRRQQGCPWCRSGAHWPSGPW